MGIIDNIRNLFAGKREIKEVHDWQKETADAEQWTLPDSYIFATQADMYRLDNNVGTAVDALGNLVGTSGFNVKRRTKKDNEEKDIDGHDFELLLDVPNPLNTKLELLRDTVSNYKLNGNAVWWLNRGGDKEQPDEIWHIPFNKITPIPDEQMYLRGYAYDPGNGKEAIFLPVWQVVHFKTFNPNNSFVGLSPLESIALTIAGNYGMRKTNKTTYVEHGGSPNSILAFKDFINNEAWEDVKREKQRAAMKNEMMMLRGVGDGVSWMSRALSSKDMDFIETLRQNMTDTFNRLCPGLLAMLDSGAKYSNANAGRATFDELTLWPMLEMMAQKITAEILPAYGRGLKGTFDDPRQTDLTMEVKLQEAYERTHTVDEVRKEKYGDNPLGDERGKMLVSEIRTQSVQVRAQQDMNEQEDEQPENDEVSQNEQPEEEPEDETAKAALEDLMRLKRMALKGKADKIAMFKSDAITSTMLRDIRAKLEVFTEKEDIIKLFDAKADSLKAKPKINPDHILRSIEAGVRALELKG